MKDELTDFARVPAFLHLPKVLYKLELMDVQKSVRGRRTFTALRGKPSLGGLTHYPLEDLGPCIAAKEFERIWDVPGHP